MANSFVFNFDTPSKTLNRILRYDYYGYPRDFIDRYQRAIQAVTREDVLRVARERLHPKDFTIVAVGNPQQFGTALATLGLPVASIDLTIPEPKSEPAPKADAAGAEKGKQLLKRAQQAAGGADKLAAVKDMEEVAEFHMDPSAPGANMKRTDRWVAPSYFREDTQLPFGVISIYADGKTGWMASPQGSGPLPPEQMTPVRDKLLRLYFAMLLSDRLPGRTVSLTGDGALGIADEQGDTVRLFIDEKSGLPAKVEYATPSMGGAPSSTIDETFDSFEEVNGIKVPNRLTIIQNGHKYAEVTVQSLKINTGLKPEDLNKKP